MKKKFQRSMWHSLQPTKFNNHVLRTCCGPGKGEEDIPKMSQTQHLSLGSV